MWVRREAYRNITIYRRKVGFGAKSSRHDAEFSVFKLKYGSQDLDLAAGN
jgi:hypothetical protein